MLSYGHPVIHQQEAGQYFTQSLSESGIGALKGCIFTGEP